MTTYFYRYMYRRCKFLDECPGFIFNIGKGEVLKKRQFRKDPIYTNTEHLGSILMETMLEEVKVFCNPEVTKKWANPEYQQVCQICCLHTKCIDVIKLIS